MCIKSISSSAFKSCVVFSDCLCSTKSKIGNSIVDQNKAANASTRYRLWSKRYEGPSKLTTTEKSKLECLAVVLLRSLAMAAALPSTRALFALACFALLITGCFAGKKHKRKIPEYFDNDSLPNCSQHTGGLITRDAYESTFDTPPYKPVFKVKSVNHCKLKGKRIVGHTVQACDPLGMPPPSIKVYNKLIQDVKCHSDGPCPAGLTVKIKQYCSKKH